LNQGLSEPVTGKNMQRTNVARAGFLAGVAAFGFVLTFDIVQFMQLLGWLHFPLDEILIYAASLCIVIPFMLEMLALHHVTELRYQYWTHAALLFTLLYAVFVVANYVVQLATVIPAKISGAYESVRLLDQAPHSLFWDFDAIAYIAMGLAMLVAIPALKGRGAARWVRRAFIAHALTTPFIAVVYFYPGYSETLLLLGLPWAVTAPWAMLALALYLAKRDIQRSS